MTTPIVRVLKAPPSPMGVRPVREGVLQRQLVAEQRAEAVTFGPNGVPVNIIDTAPLPTEGILVPEEPTPAMIAAGEAALGAEPVVGGVSVAAIWSAMLDARYDPPPMDTQSLFGASKSEIEAALVLYRKMKAPKKRGAKKQITSAASTGSAG